MPDRNGAVDEMEPLRGEAIRAELRAELEATRTAFHELLDSIPEEDWSKPSSNPAWTIKEVLFHMSLAPRMLPSDVRLIRRLGWAPRVPAGPFNWLNKVYTRLGARRLTRAGLAEKYDAAHGVAVRLLETIAEDEWEKGMQYPDWDPLLSGYVTIERLFRYLTIHFESHAEQIRRGLQVDPDIM